MATIFGILSLCFCCGPISLIFGIVAVAVGTNTKKKSRNTVGGAGVVLGVIGTIGSLLTCIGFIAYMMFMTNSYNEYELVRTDRLLCDNVQAMMEYRMRDASVLEDSESVAFVETYSDGEYHDLALLLDGDTRLAELVKEDLAERGYSVTCYGDLHDCLVSGDYDNIEFLISDSNVKLRIQEMNYETY